MVLQPRLSQWVKARAARLDQPIDPIEGEEREVDSGATTPSMPAVSLILITLVFIAGIYGGYFVAAQGILLMGILGVFLAANIQQANGVKNVLIAVVNITAGISYIIMDYLVRAPDDRVILWGIVLTIAMGSTLGGVIGAWIGRRLSARVLRAVIVTLGLTALIVMLNNLFEWI